LLEKDIFIRNEFSHKYWKFIKSWVLLINQREFWKILRKCNFCFSNKKKEYNMTTFSVLQRSMTNSNSKNIFHKSNYYAQTFLKARLKMIFSLKKTKKDDNFEETLTCFEESKNTLKTKRL